MNKSINLQRDVPVRHVVDVFVAGGGPAGIAAAVTAARQGRSVFLVEGQSCFGGSGTAGGLSMFCFLRGGNPSLTGGIGQMVCERLERAGGVVPAKHPNLDVFYRIEALKRVYDDLVSESGAQFTFCTQCLSVEVKDGRIDAVICWGKSGLFAVKAGVYIDCTGDGDLCAWAGAPFEKGDAEGGMQAGTLCSMWADIDWNAANAAGHGLWQQEQYLPLAIADKVFTVEDRHLPGMIPAGEHIGGGNIGHIFGLDGTDERSVTQALVRARKSLLEYERFYKQYLKGYEHMQLVATAAMLGIRETRRIQGDYILVLDDFRKRAVFPDEIGRFNYPVDIHQSKPGGDRFDQYRQDFESLRYQPGESYGIPYRCLTPGGLDNVLVAGRCVSADRYLQGSIRVMPGCFITGQAAGMAATLAVERKTHTRGFPVGELQQRLKTMGAFLPNATKS